MILYPDQFFGRTPRARYFVGLIFLLSHDARLIASRIGAVVAAGIYTIFPENPVALAIFGFFFSIPCFYIIVAKPDYATSGRFVLLTYNLTCLFSYVILPMDILKCMLIFEQLQGIIYDSMTLLFLRSLITDLRRSLSACSGRSLYHAFGGPRKQEGN